LPARLAQIGQESLDLIGGSFLVRADGTCEQSFEVLHTYPESEEIEVESYACTWERTGNTLVMTRLDGYRATARILGPRLSLDGPDVATLTYER
jgi:hypothetical protein